jgi:uncharacterized protein YndB with AHSA1/START domain
MPKVSEELQIPATLAETWRLYFDPASWSRWVDEFRALDSISDDYPEAGARLVWHSGPAGRGQVSETVLEHEPRRLHRIRFADPSSEGELTTTFRIEGDGTRVGLELDYSLVSGGLFSRVTDIFFIRSQMAQMLIRSLEGLRTEAGDLANAPAPE